MLGKMVDVDGGRAGRADKKRTQDLAMIIGTPTTRKDLVETVQNQTVARRNVRTL